MAVRLRNVLPRAACVLAPAVVVAVIVQIFFRRSLLAFAPAWTDEINYWREICTFRAVGFGGGYYTFDELPARAAFTHFGAHGPVFAALIGTLSLVTGWGLAYAPLFNLAFLCAAIAAFLRMTRIGGWQLLTVALSILFFWPILLYLPTAMQESLHQALAILLAGFFYLLIKQRDQLNRALYYCALGTLVVASLLRPTWAPLFLPLLLFRARVLTLRKVLLSGLMAALLVVASFLATTWLASPYPNFVGQLTDAAKHSRRAAVVMLLHHFRHGIVLLTQGSPLELLVRGELLAVIVLAAGSLAYRTWRTRRSRLELDDLGLFHLLNLVPILVISLAFYDIFDWRDYRVFAPHLLLSVVVSVPFARNAFAVPPLIANLLFVAVFSTTFQSFHSPHFAPRVSAGSPLAAVTYDPHGDAWRNTLLADIPNFNVELTRLPPGIGVSTVVTPDQIKQPLKSRYLLLNDATLQRMGNPHGLKVLGSTPYGKLYVREG